MTTRKFAIAAIVATVLCLVFATRVFVSFEPRRVKLVRTPIAARTGAVVLSASTDGRTAVLAPPVAVIASITNLGASPQAFTIHSGGTRVCDARIAAGATQRLDCVAGAGWTPAETISIRQDGDAAWQLDYLELATHHGSSTRGVLLFVLPDVAHDFGRPGPFATGLMWCMLAALLTLPAPRWAAWLTYLHRALAGGALALLMAALVSPWLSSFLVVLSAASFVRLIAVIAAPQIVFGLSWAWRRAVSVYPQLRLRRELIAVGVVPILVLVEYGVVLHRTASRADGQASSLLRVSQRAFDRVPLLQERPDVRSSLVLYPDKGYDAQFHYFAMFDPLMQHYRHEPHRYRDVADAPPYRFGRIGFPWLALVIAGSHWEWYPAAMVFLVWLGAGLSALALALIARHSGRSPAWGLLVLLIPGFWQSARVALPEPLAAALLLLGYWCVRSHRVAAAAVLFGGALLIRETGVLFVLAIALLTRSQDLSPRGRAGLLLSMVPAAAWRGYVCWVLWPDWGWQGLFYSPHSIGVPFAGLIELWSMLSRGGYYPDVPVLMRAAIWLPVVLLGACAAAVAVSRRVERPVGAALIGYAVIAVSLTYGAIWVHVANAQRGSFEVFVMLALASTGFRDYSPTIRRLLVAVWAGAGAYLLYGAIDAPGLLGVLLPWD